MRERTEIIIRWAKEFKKLVDEVICDSRSGVPRIFTIEEQDRDFLETLYGLFRTECTDIVIEDDTVQLWTPACGDRAIVYLADDEKYGSQGFAGVIRDAAGPSGYTLILLGTPEMILIETIRTTDTKLTGRGFGSRADIIDRYMKSLKRKGSDFGSMLEAISGTRAYRRLLSSDDLSSDTRSGFDRVMSFLMEVENAKSFTDLDFTELLPIIELPPGRYGDADTIVSALKKLDDFAHQLHNRFTERKQVFDLLTDYYDELVIDDIEAWCFGFKGHNMSEFGQYLRTMPEPLYLSSQKIDQPTRLEREDRIQLERVRFVDEDKLNTIEISDRVFYIVKEPEAELEYDLSKKKAKTKLGVKWLPFESKFVKKSIPSKKKSRFGLADWGLNSPDFPGDGVYSVSFSAFEHRARKAANEITIGIIRSNFDRDWFAFPEGVEYDINFGYYVLDINKIKFLVSGTNAPSSVSITFVEMDENVKSALEEAAPHIDELSINRNTFTINISDINRAPGEDWSGYIVIRDLDGQGHPFLIPVLVPGESRTLEIQIPEFYVITSLKGKHQVIPRFKTGKESAFDEEVATTLNHMISDEQFCLSRIIGKVYSGEGRVQAQMKIRAKPELVKINYDTAFLLCEKQFLKNPSDPFPISLSDNLEPRHETINQEWNLADCRELNSFNSFIALRKKLFKLLQPVLAFPLLDLTEFEEEICSYVQAYGELLADKSILSEIDGRVKPAYGALQFIDCVFICDGKGDAPIVLMSPLHPLKMLYHLLFQKKMNSLITDLLRQGGDSKEFQFSGGDLKRLTHSDIPDILTMFTQTTSMVYRFSGTASHYWSVFLTSKFPVFDMVLPLLPGKLEEFIRTAVTVRERGAYTDIATSIRERITQYLSAHFYVNRSHSPLRLLFLNVGEGQEVVDALKELYRFMRNSGQDLDISFDIKLVEITSSRGIAKADVGRAFRKFLTMTGRESRGYENLIPRITYSILEVPEIRNLQDHDVYAHIVFVQRAFDIDATYMPSRTDGFPDSISPYAVHVESRTDYHGPERRYIVGTNVKLTVDHLETPEFVLTNTFWKFRRHQTNGYCSTSEETHLLKLHLSVSNKIQDLIDWLHNRCNWVCILDRHFTQEHFEKELALDDNTILLNYTPKYEREEGAHVLLTTTTHTDLVIKSMSQHFQTHVDIDIDATQSRRLISIMNQLSGTWVLSSLTLSYTALRGNLGMGAAALWLLNGQNCTVSEKNGVQIVKDAKIVVPIGDYIRPYWLGAPRSDRKREDTRYCDDLLELYIELLDNRVILQGRLIEVKMHKNSIPAKACRQIRGTHGILSKRFALDAKHPARPFIDRELAQMVDFYGRKMFRYNRWRGQQGSSIPENTCYDFITQIVDKIKDGQYDISFDWNGRKGTIVGFTSNPNAKLDCHDIEVVLFGKEETKRILDGDYRSEYCISPLEKAADRIDPSAIEETPVQLDDEPAVVSSDDSGMGRPSIEPKAPTKGSRKTKRPATQTDPSIFMVAEEKPPEWGIIAQRSGAHIALNLHEPMSVSLFGVPGSGKSYTAGVILEAAQGLPGEITELKNPLTCLVFHYSEQEKYAPEFITFTEENQRDSEIAILRNKYASKPAFLSQIKVAVPPKALKRRGKEYSRIPGVHVLPIFLRPDELNADEWILLMGAGEGNQLYIRRIEQIISNLWSDDELTLENVMDLVMNDTSMTNWMRDLALMRLSFTSDYLSDTVPSITEEIQRGNVVVFDLREPAMKSFHAFALFSILTRVLTEPKEGNVLILIDEAHKYFQSQTSDSILKLAREIRHRGATLVVASQDPSSIDSKIIEMSNMIISHKMTSGKWLKHLAKSCGAFKKLELRQFENLRAGEAWLWTSKASPSTLAGKTLRVRIRPRATQHGGASKTN